MCNHCGAQQTKSRVSGSLLDSTTGSGVEGASVSIIKNSDSSFVTFVITDSQGNFFFESLQPGRYQLHVSHINYKIVKKNFAVDRKNNQTDFGIILMVMSPNLLEEITVQSESPPITMKGDTTEFNAGSFKTAPNASVESLLKKLPGFYIDKDGTINLNGEKIRNVLVDGKSFFGNNPKTATRNLPADAIDKIQVFDKLTESSELSGFNDGSGSKTINLTFKKDRRKGGFGKVNAAKGTQDRYLAKGNLNRFNEKQQMSLIGGANNINEEITSIAEGAGMSKNMERLNSGSNYQKLKPDLTADNSIVTAAGAGINFNGFNDPREDMHGDCLYYFDHPMNISRLSRQFFSPVSPRAYEQQQQASARINTSLANAVFEKRLKEIGALKFSASFNRKKSSNKLLKTYNTSEQNGTIINEGNTQINSEEIQQYGVIDITYKKKMKHRGRSFFFSLSTEIRKTEITGQQQSENIFYGQVPSLIKDTINQRTNSYVTTTGFLAKAIFTEGLFKSSLLEISTAAHKANGKDLIAAYDFNTVSKNYDLLNNPLSNQSENTYEYQNMGFRFRNEKYKTGFYLGTLVQRSELQTKLKENIASLTRNFINVLPNASFKFSPSKYKSITLLYATFITPPANYLLQPVTDNSDPLNIRQGNSSLKPEYNHNASLSFKSLHPYKSRFININVNYLLTRNKITMSDSTGLSGINTYRPVNRNGAYSIFSNINFSRKVPVLNGYISLGANNYFSKTPMISYGQVTSVTSLSLGPEMKLTANAGSRCNFTLSTRINYINVRYAMQSMMNRHYFNQYYEIETILEMPKNIILQSEFSYSVNTGLSKGFNQALPLLNASISKLVLKNNKGEIKCAVADLFNKNNRISREATRNYLEDSESSLLRRFFSIGFTYSLSRVGLSSAGK
ncbi:MAG: outer rane beta-barrel protein [Chitinophagaceae bacterium]|nr:outer rane beta-barrel protein [Chitinophagaceae bacterium]